jgi:hypothetical protein
MPQQGTQERASGHRAPQLSNCSRCHGAQATSPSKGLRRLSRTEGGSGGSEAWKAPSLGSFWAITSSAPASRHRIEPFERHVRRRWGRCECDRRESADARCLTLRQPSTHGRRTANPPTYKDQAPPSQPEKAALRRNDAMWSGRRPHGRILIGAPQWAATTGKPPHRDNGRGHGPAGGNPVSTPQPNHGAGTTTPERAAIYTRVSTDDR